MIQDPNIFCSTETGYDIFAGTKVGCVSSVFRKHHRTLPEDKEIYMLTKW